MESQWKLTFHREIVEAFVLNEFQLAAKYVFSVSNILFIETL